MGVGIAKLIRTGHGRLAAFSQVVDAIVLAGSLRALAWAFGVDWTEDARVAVKEMADLGYDFIKLTLFLTPPVYDAIVDEAKRRNIRVVGHVDPQVGVARALAAGQQPRTGTQEPGRHTSEPVGGPTTLREMVTANHDYRGEW